MMGFILGFVTIDADPDEDHKFLVGEVKASLIAIRQLFVAERIEELMGIADQLFLHKDQGILRDLQSTLMPEHIRRDLDFNHAVGRSRLKCTLHHCSKWVLRMIHADVIETLWNPLRLDQVRGMCLNCIFSKATK